MSKPIIYTQKSLKLAIDATWKTIMDKQNHGFFKNEAEMNNVYDSFSPLWIEKI